MTQYLQESEEIERRVSSVVIENMAEVKEADPELVNQPIEVLESKIRGYTWMIYAIGVMTGITSFAALPNFYYFKDVLKENPDVYMKAINLASLPWSLKPISGYLQDSINLGGYRSKGWILFATLLAALVSVKFFLQAPSVSSFTYLFFLLTLGAVIGDGLAAGLSVMIIGLKKAHAEALGRQNGNRESAILRSIEKSETEGKKIYGNYTLLRFMIRNVVKFAGGVLAETFTINMVYGVIGVVEISVLLFVLVVPEVKEVKWINEEAGNIFTLFKLFLKSIFRKDILAPFGLALLVALSPTVPDTGDYIVTDELGWSPLIMSINTLAASLIYFVGMLYIVNFAENLSFRNKMFIGAVSALLANFVLYRFTIYESFSFVPMFTIHIVQTIFQNLNAEFFIIALVARYSNYCPKGMESFSIAALNALINFCGLQGSLISAEILEYYHIEKGNYYNLIYPVAISFGCSVITLLLSPVLGK